MNIAVQIHLTTGLIILATVISRLWIQFVTPRPAIDSRIPHWQRLTAEIVHSVMLAVVAVQCCLGLSVAWLSGRTITLFGLIPLPSLLNENVALASKVQFVHLCVALTLAGLVAVHLSAIVYNAIVHRINVVTRLLPPPNDTKCVNHIPLSAQIYGAIGVMTIACAVGAAFGVSSIERASEDGFALFDRGTELRRSVDTLTDAYDALVDHPSWSTPDAPMPEDAQESQARFIAALETLRNSAAPETIRSAAGALKLKAEHAVRQGRLTLTELEACRPDVERLARSVEASVMRQRYEAQAASALRRDILIGSLVPLTLLAIILATMVAINVVGTVRRIRRVAERIAAHEDVDQIEVRGRGEAATLIRSLMTMQRAVKKAEEDRLAAEREQQRTQEAAERKRAEAERREKDQEHARAQALAHFVDGVAEGLSAAAQGDYSVRIGTQFDEPTFNTVAEGINGLLREVTRQMDEVMRLADENIRAQKEAEKDREAALETARAATMARVKNAFGRVVSAAEQGDFSHNVVERFEDETLNELADGINTILATVRTSFEDIARANDERLETERLEVRRRAEERASERQAVMQRVADAFEPVLKAAAAGQYDGRVANDFGEPVLDSLAAGVNGLLLAVSERIEESVRLTEEAVRLSQERALEQKEAEDLRSRQEAETRARTMEELSAAFGQVVDAAAAGDFSHRIEQRFDEPVLDSLALGVNTILTSVEDGLKDVQGVMSRVASADLSVVSRDLTAEPSRSSVKV